MLTRFKAVGQGEVFGFKIRGLDAEDHGSCFVREVVEQGEEVRFVGDNVLHVNFEDEVGHGRFASTLKVLLEAVDHPEEGRAALVDEAEKNQPCLEGERIVGKHVLHAFLGQNFGHLRFQCFSVQPRSCLLYTSPSPRDDR